MKRNHLPILTSLRFFAAMLVVCHHFGQWRDLSTAAFLKAIGGFGFEAVTFFFLLSGFVLTYAHVSVQSGRSEMNVSAPKFYLARIARILPAYYVALAIALPPFAYSAFVSHTVGRAEFAASLGAVPLLLQAWLPPIALKWNGPAWSLSVEALFYAVFPLLVVRLHRLRAVGLMAGCYAFVLLGVYLSTWTSAAAGTAEHHFFAYFPLLHLPEFAFGMALAVAFLAGGDRKDIIFDVCFALSLALAAIVIACKAQFGWLSSNAVLVPLFGAIILSGAGARSQIMNLAFGARPLVFLGDASYSIYILHAPIAMWWRWGGRRLGVELDPITDFVLYGSLIICASIACLVLIERPARRFILRRFGGGQRAAQESSAEPAR